MSAIMKHNNKIHNINFEGFELQKMLKFATLLGFLILTISLLFAIRSDVRNLSILNLNISMNRGASSLNMEDIVNVTMQKEDVYNSSKHVIGDIEAIESPMISFNNSGEPPVDLFRKPSSNLLPTVGEESPKTPELHDSEMNTTLLDDKFLRIQRNETDLNSPPEDVKKDENSDQVIKDGEFRFNCDVSEPRTDVCEAQGDIRVHGSISTIFVVRPSTLQTPIKNTTRKIRPYARKWEAPTMATIRELTIKSTPNFSPQNIPTCDVNYQVPAVIFSTGGFQGNFFHELTDVLVPLFLTTNQYKGEVRLLIVDYKSWWVKKYKTLLTRLSRYEVINMESDTRVHCFNKVVVGLRSHKELGIDPGKIPVGESMVDFRKFLRLGYSLKKHFVNANLARATPKLILISRKKSRAILNERRVIRMARGLGMKVVVAKAEMTKNLTLFASIVNSCDIMMGVHGAGLSNMVFLPDNATVIQIIPWGELKYACRFAFGEPAKGMGFKYLDYEIKKEESSLINKYPMDHVVFRDPLSIHKKGFSAIWSTFLNKQDVRLNVERLKLVLLEAMQSYSH